MRNFGENKIYKIACGPRNDDYHWTEVLMQNGRNMRGGWLMDGLSLHYYTPDGPFRLKQSATNFEEQDWAFILNTCQRMDTLITRHSAIMDQYDPERKVGLVVDEWGTWYGVEPGTHPRFLYQQNSLRDALVAALTLNIFNKHAGRVTMGNIAQTVNVLQALILTDPDSGRMLRTPTFHVFEMYRAHHDAELCHLDVRCGTYMVGEHTMPSLSASASRDTAGTVSLTICNVDPGNAAEVRCDVRGMKARRVTGRVLTAPLMQAHNTFDSPDNLAPVPFTGAVLDGDTLGFTMPAKSVVALVLSH